MEEMKQWEIAHFNLITGWRSEWDIKPNVKIVTFTYNEDGKKKEKSFEIHIL